MTAKEYIKEWETARVWSRYSTGEKHIARLKNCALACEGKTIIDVGCAFGHSTAIMESHRPGSWFGVDFYEDTVKKVNKYNPGICVFFSPDYEIKKNVGRGFDSVVCSEVIEHIHPDKQQFFFDQIIELANKKVILTTPAKKVNSAGHYKTHYLREDLELLINNNKYIKKYTLEQGGLYWYLCITKKAGCSDEI